MAKKSSIGAKWRLAAAALAGLLAGVLAANVLPFGPALADHALVSRPATQTGAVVDRTHKGDRLDTLMVPTKIVSPRRDGPRMSRAPLKGCEPPASPFVDPLLAKLPGRCLT